MDNEPTDRTTFNYLTLVQAEDIFHYPLSIVHYQLSIVNYQL
jgi:hypothetical protein